MELLKALNWRHATKKMNGNKVPDAVIDQVLQAIQLAPSSMGLQPYTVLVITDPVIKDKVKSIAYNQLQVVDCSHLLVFAAWSDISTVQVDEFIENTASIRNTPVAELTDFRNMIIQKVSGNTAEENYEWATRQAYIAFGTAIAAAAELKVDATPMEGFNAPALDDLLGLKEKGLRSVTLLPLGYRDEANDWLATLPKVRRQKEKLFIVQ